MSGTTNFNADITRWKRQWSRSGHVQRTLEEYISQMHKYLAWCEQTGSQSNALESADSYIAHVEATSRHAARWAARAIKAYGKYLADDEQVSVSPFKRLKLPIEPAVQNAPTATDDDLAKLLATCKPKKIVGSAVEWAHLRDRALLLTIAHTGMRRHEVADMQLNDLDLSNEVIYVPLSKTKSTRRVALHPDAAGAILRYLRASDVDRTVETGVWLSERAIGGTRPFTSGALSQMLDRRGTEAGVDVRAHAFRRRFAGNWMAKGGSETGLMNHAGWKTTAMIGRYTKDVREANAIAEARRLFA